MSGSFGQPSHPALVALDIDGTILDDDGLITERVRAAVAAVAASGRHVVLSTGRSLSGTTPVLERLDLRSGYAVTSNGAVTVRLDPVLANGVEVVDQVMFDPAPALRLLREELPQAVYAVEDGTGGFRLNAPFPPDELMGHLTIVPFQQLLEHPVCRVIVRSPEHTSEHFLELIERLGLHGGSYMVGWTGWLDIAPGGISKAHGLTVVADRLGLAPADVLAVGDGRNDLEMFAWAGASVAMGQASAEVRAAADAVCGTVQQDGLADVLEGLNRS